RNLLTDVVVQLARDPGTFALLRIQQPRSHVANPVVTPNQLDLFRAKLLFRLSPTLPLYKESSDQRHLREQHCNSAPDIGAVAYPDGWFFELDQRSGRNARLADVPALQLTPVHLSDIDVGGRNRNMVRLFATQHAEPQGGERAHLERLIFQAASHD